MLIFVKWLKKNFGCIVLDFIGFNTLPLPSDNVIVYDIVKYQVFLDTKNDNDVEW